MKNIDLPMLFVWGATLGFCCGAFFFLAKIIGIL